MSDDTPTPMSAPRPVTDDSDERPALLARIGELERQRSAHLAQLARQADELQAHAAGAVVAPDDELDALAARHEQSADTLRRHQAAMNEAGEIFTACLSKLAQGALAALASGDVTGRGIADHMWSELRRGSAPPWAM